MSFRDTFVTGTINNDYDCLEAMEIAIKKHDSKTNVKAQLGNELIAILDQTFQVYLHELENDFEQIYFPLTKSYEDLKALLGFNLFGAENVVEDSDVSTEDV